MEGGEEKKPKKRSKRIGENKEKKNTAPTANLAIHLRK